MSNLNRNENYKNLATAVNFFMSQVLKSVHTAIPGIIRDYDIETKRATVEPAINLLTTSNESMERAPIIQVPVLMPSAGGFTISMPIKKGDLVMLIFSERDIGEFKKTLSKATPDPTFILDTKDAVAIPGFLSQDIVLEAERAALQNNENTASFSLGKSDSMMSFGENRLEMTNQAIEAVAPSISLKETAESQIIEITDNNVTVSSGTTRITISPDGITLHTDGTFDISASSISLTAPNLTHNNINVGATHIHPGVQSGSGTTLPPQ